MDARGSPDVGPATLLDDPAGRPARTVRARVDESYVHLSVRLAEPVPARLTVGLDVLPALTGPPPPGGTDPRPDTAVVLDLVSRTGQAWIRTDLDPLPLDAAVPAVARPAPNTPRSHR